MVNPLPIVGAISLASVAAASLTTGKISYQGFYERVEKRKERGVKVRDYIILHLYLPTYIHTRCVLVTTKLLTKIIILSSRATTTSPQRRIAPGRSSEEQKERTTCSSLHDAGLFRME